jgi:phosphatidylglycerol---prolipoprotein diacylglyceryl transferase
MIPFLHLGPLSIPTYGLMVAIGLLVAAYILQAEFDRRRGELEKIKGFKGQKDEGFLVIGLAGITGLIAARLYSALESPAEFLANPRAVLLSRYGLTWFGAFFGGFVVLIFVARRWKIPLLWFLDMCSVPSAAGYAIGRIGCQLSGDGDYGVPTTLPWGMSFPNGIVPTTERVHPTPVYEFLVGMAIAWFLWRLGTKALGGAKPKGEIFCYYLMLTGAARFLVEFIRINPRLVLQEGHFRWIDYAAYSQLTSHSWFAFSNAQVVSFISIVIGIAIMLRLKFSTEKVPKRPNTQPTAYSLQEK